jgi:transcriptional regulator GlxA family with amidase domain
VTAESRGSSAQQHSGTRGVVRGHAVVAVRILRTRLAEPWTLNSLAEQVHLSRSQLVRAFDSTIGMSPMAYLRQIRVQHMASLLCGTDLSIAEVARTVGWADANYASRCFHIHYGTSPTGSVIYTWGSRTTATPAVDGG